MNLLNRRTVNGRKRYIRIGSSTTVIPCMIAIPQARWGGEVMPWRRSTCKGVGLGGM